MTETTARVDALVEALRMTFSRALGPTSLRVFEEEIARTTPPALSASPAPAVAEGWRSMDSAPKDGARIDVWLGDDEFPMRRTEVYWGRPHHECGEAGSYCDSCPPDRDMWCDDLLYGEPEDLNPTHWRPIPPAPSASPAQAEQGEALTEARETLQWLIDQWEGDGWVTEQDAMAMRARSALDRLSAVSATPQAGEGREALEEVLNALGGIINWCDLALANRSEFDSHGVQNLTGPAFDVAREVLAKHAAALAAARKEA